MGDEVSRHTHAATFLPGRFYCLLDELPMHLVPRPALRAIESRNSDNEDLLLNPECRLMAADDLPEELDSATEIVKSFALQGTMAWVRDTAGGGLLPFWLGPKFAAHLGQLRASRSVGPIPRDAVRTLAAAGIFVAEGWSVHARRLRDEMISTAGAMFRLRGYAPLPGLIHPFHVAALRRYYRYLIRSGSIHLGDGQSPLRYIAHNDPVARFFHQQIAPVLSAVTGEPLKPSYVYLASYLNGAELRKHTDREQCEFSITLCLDFSPEPELATPWPIKLDTRSGTVSVHQALGDGLAYRGTILPHYRDPLGAGQTSTSIFFHYVSSDFKGSMD